MRLTVVGCSGSFPGPDSPASCYLVEHDGHRILLDLGNGALGALQRHTDIYDVDAVVVSHLHADHCLDLCSYYVARTYRPGDALPPVPVHGPPGTLRRLVAAYETDPASMSRALDVQDVAPSFEVGPFQITTALMDHPVEAYGIRVEAEGRSLVYSGDTGPTPALVDLARGADLLLAEASFVDGEDNAPHLHMTGRDAGKHARMAGVGRLVVTHVPPWHSVERAWAEATSAYDGEVLAAASGLVVDV